jgi:hypothetical protein
MLYKETNVTCSQTYRKHKNILCGYNVEVLKGWYKEVTTRLEMENHSQEHTVNKNKKHYQNTRDKK